MCDNDYHTMPVGIAPPVGRLLAGKTLAERVPVGRTALGGILQKAEGWTAEVVTS
jgi:hypothetical protein